jgi:hypothetical protein
MSRFSVVAAIVITSWASNSSQAVGAGDDKAPPAPPIPSPQSPAPEMAPLKSIPTPGVVSVPIQLAAQQPPASTLHTVQLRVITEPSAPEAVKPPVPQALTVPISFSVVPSVAPPPAQTAVQPAPVAPAAAVPMLATIHHPGPIRTAIGSLGEWLAETKKPWVRVAAPQAQAQVLPVAYTTVVAQPAAAQVLVAAPQAQVAAQLVEMQPVMASPQAPAKHRLFNFRR